MTETTTNAAQQAPPLGGVHHFSPTVTDIEASAAWYQRVFGLERIPVPFPHHGAEETGHAVLLSDPVSGFIFGLHHHTSNAGEAFDEVRTGLDHMAFSVPDRAALVTWGAWLDELGVRHSGITDMTAPFPYSLLVFRDPDNIQLELFCATS